jgi:hypothetical protein
VEIAENKVQKSGKFSAPKNVVSSDHVSPRNHHKITSNLPRSCTTNSRKPPQKGPQNRTFLLPASQKKIKVFAKFLA